VNGSGKSTILKLISRLYDPVEGTILIDDQDIKTFKLTDLRRAMATLFQDYTHFPLSVSQLSSPPVPLTSILIVDADKRKHRPREPGYSL